MATSATSHYGPSGQTREEAMMEISERIMVMRDQEVRNYRVPDYLAAEWQQKLREASASIPGDDDDEDDDEAVAMGNDDIQEQVNGSSAAFPSSNPASANNAVGMDGTASSSSSSSQINEVWREKICEWCYQVVDHFDFHREVVSVAISYLDRYLATRTVNRRIFQLAAMTALYLAIKLFEPGKLRMSSLIDLSRGYFLAEHIVTMEDSMLQSLRWHVHPPTPFAFCRDLMRLVSSEIGPRTRHDVNELARFMTELSVCDYWFAQRKPSSIALASLINAMELQGPRRVEPRHKIEFLHRAVAVGMDISNDQEIMDCYDRLREMYNQGGYTPNLEEGGEEMERHGGRVATVSPTGVADGPDAEDLDDDEMSQMECA